MKCSAWIRTCVDVFDHPILDNGPYDRRSAWLWLIAKAARFDKRVNHKGKPLEIKRGQLLAGRAFLADTWGWSEKQVRLFLNLLAADFMIEKGQSNGHYANVITICNYDVYQTAPAKKQPVEGPERGQCRASAGPVQGQTLTENTDIQELVSLSDAGARENSEPEIPDGFEPLGHGALINCETIRHPEFVISIPAVKMALALSNLQVDARNACSAAALQWAAALEGGQKKRDVVPGNITGAIVGGVRMGRFRELEHETRTARAAAGKPQGTARLDYAEAKTERNKAFLDRLRNRKSAEANQ